MLAKARKNSSPSSSIEFLESDSLTDSTELISNARLILSRALQMSRFGEMSSLPVFPSDNAPRFDPDTWRLRIGGLVNREQNLSLSDLMSLPSVKIQDDFTCLEGWTVNGIVWRGVRVSELLSLASMKPTAKCVLFGSGDYTQGLTIERCMVPTTILAYELNNAPLSFENGAPLRLISKGQDCFESVKWVNTIHVIDRLVQGSAKNISSERIQKK